MFIKPEDLSDILRQEQEYIDSLKARWGGVELLPSAEQALRMGKRSELLGDLECQQRRESNVDSGQAIKMPHMMSVAREWLAAENQRMAQAGETDYCGSPAHIVGWLLAEVQRLRLVICDRIAELGEEMESAAIPKRV